MKPYENKREMDFYTPEEFKKYIQVAKEQAEPIRQSTGSIYEWISMYFLISHSIRVCVKVK